MSSGEKTSNQKHVAIVGGGFGGCASAYFLRRLMGENVVITVFEKSGYLGGRVHTVNIGNNSHEAGASIFTSGNKYMNQFVKNFDLKSLNNSKENKLIALYSGHGKVAFSSITGFSLWNNLRFLWLYGWDYLKLRYHTKKLANQFEKIYELQDKGVHFQSPSSLLSALSPDFLRMTAVSYRSWLTDIIGLKPQFCNDIGFTFSSNCYCQNMNVHAFVGMIASAGGNYGLYSVKGGNEQIARSLCTSALEANPPQAAKDFLHAEVQLISPGKNRNYRLDFVDVISQNKQFSEFDYVVLAVPIHQEATISARKGLLPPPRQYQLMHKTFFNGDLNFPRFGLPESVSLKKISGFSIIPTLEGYEGDKTTLIRTLTRNLSVNNETGDSCWSTFSVPERVADPFNEIPRYYTLSQDPGHTLECIRWLAYPTYNPVNDPTKDLGEFVLAPGLIYANAIENIASCMEIALIGGRNAALLINADCNKENI